MSVNNLYSIQGMLEPLNEEELIENFKKYYAGDQMAREKLILHNIRLVFYEVEKKFNNTIYEKKELVQWGIIGLMNGIDHYDLSKHKKFTVYALRCIDTAILMFLRKEKKYREISHLDEVFFSERGGEEFRMIDYLQDETINTSLDYANQQEKEIILSIIENLSKREGEIIKMYFGFSLDRSFSQREIANRFCVSQVRISKIIKKQLSIIKEQLIEKEIIGENGLVKHKRVIRG